MTSIFVWVAALAIFLSPLHAYRFSLAGVKDLDKDSRELSDELARKAAVLVATKKSFRLQPLTTHQYQKFDIPENAWNGFIVDFDYQQTKQKIAVLSHLDNEGTISRLHLIDFPNLVSYSDLKQNEVSVSHAKNRSAIDGGFETDRVRFGVRDKGKVLSFITWSSQAKTRKSVPTLTIAKTVCGVPEDATKELKCDNGVFNVAKTPAEESKIMLDGAAGSTDFYSTFASVSSEEQSKTQHYVADSGAVTTVSMVNFDPSSNAVIAHDEQTKSLWVAGLNSKKRILLKQFKNGDFLRPYEVEPASWVQTADLLRLSVHNNVVCLSIKQTNGAHDVVAAALIDETKQTLLATTFEVSGLIGAICLSHKTADKLSHFAPEPLLDDNHSAGSNSLIDRGYIVLIVVGMILIFFGIIIAVGSAYALHLRRRLHGGNIRMTFHKYTEDDAEDDQFLLGNDHVTIEHRKTLNEDEVPLTEKDEESAPIV